jgi:hypothetical protein
MGHHLIVPAYGLSVGQPVADTPLPLIADSRKVGDIKSSETQERFRLRGALHAEITTSKRGRCHRCVFERLSSFLLQQNNTPTQRPKNTHNESCGALNVLRPSCVFFVSQKMRSG